MALLELRQEMQALAQPERAAFASRYFRAGPGQYGEGDVFWGIPNPALRQLAKKYPNLAPDDLQTLLNDPVHEFRLLALLILTEQFRKAGTAERRDYCEFYLANLQRVNNWDLVDVSAPLILGEYLVPLDRGLLHILAESGHLWSQRVALLATHAFVRRGDMADALQLALFFLDHPHDLIHKAVGWTLREVGKKNPALLLEFLDRYAPQMPRTALRYAIERLPEPQRLMYLRQR